MRPFRLIPAVTYATAVAAGAAYATYPSAAYVCSNADVYVLNGLPD